MLVSISARQFKERSNLLSGMQAVLVRISARLLKETLQYTDERAKLEGELLDGVDVVKCMTWEVRNILLCTMCNIPCVTYHV